MGVPRKAISMPFGEQASLAKGSHQSLIKPFMTLFLLNGILICPMNQDATP
jgi:hypothetical protein